MLVCLFSSLKMLARKTVQNVGINKALTNQYIKKGFKTKDKEKTKLQGNKTQEGHIPT